jgi:hypothetical protein
METQNIEQGPENPRRSVSAAFDSVNLINQTIPVTGMNMTQKIDIIKRNYQHLETMMAKQWFVNSLINNEGNLIQTCILNGKSFVESNNG